MDNLNENGEITLNKRCFKMEKENAKAMIDGVVDYDKVWHQSMYLGVKSKDFPMLITLNRSKTSLKLSELGKNLNADGYKIQNRYVALLDSEYFVRNEYSMWVELCKNKIFDIWNPEAPYSLFQKSKSNPSEYRIYLLRIFVLEITLPDLAVRHISSYHDHVFLRDYHVKLKRPIMADEDFNDYKIRLENILSKYLTRRDYYTKNGKTQNYDDEDITIDEKENTGNNGAIEKYYDGLFISTDGSDLFTSGNNRIYYEKIPYLINLMIKYKPEGGKFSLHNTGVYTLLNSEGQKECVQISTKNYIPELKRAEQPKSNNDSEQKLKMNSGCILDQISKEFSLQPDEKQEDNIAPQTSMKNDSKFLKNPNTNPEPAMVSDIGESDVLLSIYMQKTQKEGYENLLKIHNKPYSQEEFNYYVQLFKELRKKNVLAIIKEDGVRVVNGQNIQDYHWELSETFLNNFLKIKPSVNKEFESQNESINNISQQEKSKCEEDEIITFTDEDIRDYLIDVGLSSHVAKLLLVMKNQTQYSARALEVKAKLRQPEISIAIKEMKNMDWILEEEEKQKGKGRPVKYYSLKMLYQEIILKCIEKHEIQIAEANESRKKIKDYILRFSNKNNNNSEKICSNCGLKLDLFEKFTRCPSCDDLYCSECGQYVDPDATECPHCGIHFEDYENNGG